MKICYTLFILLFSFLHVYCQAPDWIWAKSAVGPSDNQGRALVTDSIGNIYVTGTSAYGTTFGSIYLITGKVFLAKYDPAGNELWVKGHYALGAEPNDIAIDPAGNIYVTGRFGGDSIKFDSVTLYNGNGDIFLVKYNNSGDVIWAINCGGSGNAFTRKVATGTDGNVFISGSYSSSTISFGTTTLTNQASPYLDVFVSKLDSVGNFIWTRGGGGPNSDLIKGMDTDDSGNVIITGTFVSYIYFDSLYISPGGIFIVKYDSSGVLIWAENITSSNGAESQGLNIDISGNIIITGKFSGPTLDFGQLVLNSNYSFQIFVAKYSSSGNLIWANTDGSIIYNNTTGIITDNEGNIFVTGVFHGSIDFGVTTLTSDIPYSYKNFVFKYDALGNRYWIKGINGTSDGIIFGVTVDNVGDLIVTGIFVGASFVFDSDTLNYFHGEDIFVAKLGYLCDVPVLSATVLQPFCFGQTGSASVNSSGGVPPYSYLWSTNQTSSTLSGLISGDYTVVVTDSIGCAQFSHITIAEVPSEIVYTLSSIPTNFYNPNCNGSVSINMTGGTPPYNYLWNTGSTTNLCEGWYTVIASDENGCFIIDSISVDYQCPSISLSMSSAGPLLCAGDIETITVNATGGSAPYNYLWSSGDTTPGAGLPPGLYTVTVSDANVCTATITVNFSQAPSAIISNITSTPTNFTTPNCNGSVSINPSGGMPIYNISWSSGSTTNLCEGWYTATIIDANGCAITDSVYVDFVTGIEELNATGIFVYPNPVKDILTINSQKEIGEIKIHDVVGKLIYHELIKNINAVIDVKELDAGVYFLKAENYRGKFVKQ
jgi:hypothetical protein